MSDRLRSEQHFHDQQAADRRQAWERDPASLHVSPEAYLDHEPWVRPALAKLGPLSRKRVLDFGCGHGMAAVELARYGAEVVAFDLSAGYVHETATRASANDAAVQAVVADGAKLPFRAGSFDAVWGVAILHHLPVAQAAREVKRVLAPGGVAVFCEPWGGNPLLRFARHRLPYPGKERTHDETPLRADDLALLRHVFPGCLVEYVQLLGMIRRAWQEFPFLDLLDRWDSYLLPRWPRLAGWSRYVVLTLRM